MDKEISSNNSKTKKIIFFIAILLFIFTLIFLGIKIYKPVYKLKQSEVIISTVTEKEISKVINSIAYIESSKKADIESTESGQVIYINKKNGAEVNQNDEILKLSNKELENEYNKILFEQNLLIKEKSIFYEETECNLMDYKDKLLDIEYEISKSERDLNRDRILFDTKSISKQKFVESQQAKNYWKDKKKIVMDKIDSLNGLKKSEEELLDLKINSINNKLEYLKYRLDSLTIKSSFPGVLNLENINLGQYINFRDKIGTVNLEDDFLLVSNIDEFYLSGLEIGSKAYYTDTNNRKFEVVLSYISNEIVNSKAKLEFEFKDNFPDKVKNGQRVDLKIIDSNIKQRLVINNGNFYNFSNGKWIFKIKDNIAEKVPIETGFRDNQFIEIISGLNVGDRVIISSYKNFNSYEKLKMEDI